MKSLLFPKIRKWGAPFGGNCQGEWVDQVVILDFRDYFVIILLLLLCENFDEVILCFQETIPKFIKVAEIMEGEDLVPRFHIREDSGRW